MSESYERCRVCGEMSDTVGISGKCGDCEAEEQEEKNENREDIHKGRIE